MNSLGKPFLSIGQKLIRQHLSKLRNYSSNPQSFIYLDLEADLFCIVIPLKPILVVLFGIFKMVNLDFWDMLARVCQRHVRISVTELEMSGLAINIHLWKHFLLRVEFDCAVDHRAIS